MELLNFLNGDLIFPMLALIVVILYFINRIRTRKRFKR